MTSSVREPEPNWDFISYLILNQQNHQLGALLAVINLATASSVQSYYLNSDLFTGSSQIQSKSSQVVPTWLLPQKNEQIALPFSCGLLKVRSIFNQLNLLVQLILRISYSKSEHHCCPKSSVTHSFSPCSSFNHCPPLYYIGTCRCYQQSEMACHYIVILYGPYQAVIL